MNDIDKCVGARIRLYRKALGLSQTELADKIGVRFQQVQKYESGANRVAASRLWTIADTLGVSVVTLFQDLRDNPASSNATMELLDLFHRLPESGRHDVVSYTRALAAGNTAAGRENAEVT